MLLGVTGSCTAFTMAKVSGHRLRRVAQDPGQNPLLDCLSALQAVSFATQRALVSRNRRECGPPLAWRFGTAVWNGRTMLNRLPRKEFAGSRKLLPRHGGDPGDTSEAGSVSDRASNVSSNATSTPGAPPGREGYWLRRQTSSCRTAANATQTRSGRVA